MRGTVFKMFIFQSDTGIRIACINETANTFISYIKTMFVIGVYLLQWQSKVCAWNHTHRLLTS